MVLISVILMNTIYNKYFIGRGGEVEVVILSCFNLVEIVSNIYSY